MWKIDRDYLTRDLDKSGVPDIPSRVGTQAGKDTGEPRIRFRLKDDDGNVYFGGWLNDDEECNNQSWVYDFGAYDAGTCHIEVKRDGKWVEEIG